MKKQLKIALIAGGSTAAALTLAAITAAIWNNRRLKMLRTYQKTGKILGRAATILQAISEAIE